MTPRHKLAVGGALLCASMLPLLVERHRNGLTPGNPVMFGIALLTVGLALWGARAGRVAWVLLLGRAGLQVIATGLMFAAVRRYGSSADFLHTQAGVSLALTVASIALLGTRDVRELVWSTPAEFSAAPLRPISRLGTRRILGGFCTIAVILGSIEQAWIYQHISLLELALRSLYMVLPWAGAWQLAKLGRDRVLLTTLGALLGELVSELISLVASGAEPMAVITNLLLPVGNLPALLIGLALAVFGPYRPLWQLGLALPLAQLLYRAAAVAITTTGGRLSWQAAVLAVLTGMAFACSVFLFRRAPDVFEPSGRHSTL